MQYSTKNIEPFVLYNKILTAPKNLQIEVSDFIDFLMTKYNYTEVPKKQKKRPKAGFLNVFTMKPDFDEVPECFNDYIPE